MKYRVVGCGVGWRREKGSREVFVYGMVWIVLSCLVLCGGVLYSCIDCCLVVEVVRENRIPVQSSTN